MSYLLTKNRSLLSVNVQGMSEKYKTNLINRGMFHTKDSETVIPGSFVPVRKIGVCCYYPDLVLQLHVGLGYVFQERKTSLDGELG